MPGLSRSFSMEALVHFSLPAYRGPRLAAFGSRPTGRRLERIVSSPNFADGAFRNPVPTTVISPGRSREVLKVQLTGWRRRRPQQKVPVHRLSAADLVVPPASGLRLTWLGHATVLAEIGDRRVLFDPMWSDRCSPIPGTGPRRQHPMPISLSHLPRLDAIAISHDHYDHLDMATVRALTTATSAPFIVPLGVGAHLERWRVPAQRIVELDWHESICVPGLRLTATPARHYSRRGLADSPAILWCSWVVAADNVRVFHGGDTGYFPGMLDIGVAHGPFAATMLPIGAYHDLWPDVHMTPEEAVLAHHELGGCALLPMHWGTFNLAPHPWAEPIERAIRAARQTGALLLTPQPGQPVDLGFHRQSSRAPSPPGRSTSSTARAAAP
jgi:L-ascorbate metabolism protein UlaG (beta-lactamase superfamily)